MKIAELLQSLAEAEVDYVLVGGLAVQIHGFMRATLDIDLVLAMNDTNLQRFIEIAKAYKLEPNIPVPIDTLRNEKLIEDWHSEKGMLAFSLREPQAGGKIVDIVVRPVVPYAQLAENAISAHFFGRHIKVAAIDDLLAVKRNTGRAKDLLDIEALEKIKRGEDPNV